MDTFLANRDSFLTLESPQVGAWTGLTANNHGSFPEFPLRLGNSYLVAIKSLSASVAEGLGAVPSRNIANG
jgi:hypothetical protein